MSTINEAIGETFKKHPVGMSIAALFALHIVFSNVADIFSPPATLPEKMDCVLDTADSKTSSGFKIQIGTYSETKVSIPAEQLQRLGKAPIGFVCEAR